MDNEVLVEFYKIIKSLYVVTGNYIEIKDAIIFESVSVPSVALETSEV